MEWRTRSWTIIKNTGDMFSLEAAVRIAMNNVLQMKWLRTLHTVVAENLADFDDENRP